MVNSLGQEWLCVALVIVTTCPVVSLARDEAVVVKDARHLKVFYEEGRFAGWPANNGIWQWGNEILVGFSLGYLAPPEKQGLHQIDPARPRSTMLARSSDGGETWSASEAGYPDGQLQRFGTDIAFDAPGFALNARDDKAFISLDKGRTWNGPFRLPFADLHLRARTDYQVLGPRDLALFLTAEKTNDREGRPFCVRTRTSGSYWNQFAWIGPEPPSGYSIMPSSIRMPNGDLLVALRRRDNDPAQHNFIELFRSRDGGLSWQCMANPVKENGLHSGNPPSMVRLTDGRLCITYANRNEPHTIRAALSSDDGATWGPQYVLRSGAGEPDIGYTRTVQRPDGKLVTIYYWLDKPRAERYIAATIWSAPKVD
ncbi:MAG: exo-alpha-sialidase [Planctomycetes bacterium]|nr:exo-alpha-sialidase [Planctomycetota bacterium]MBL7184764.1 exo-alpha-sialidase [Phycisphaerae bacterium]